MTVWYWPPASGPRADRIGHVHDLRQPEAPHASRPGCAYWSISWRRRFASRLQTWARWTACRVRWATRGVSIGRGPPSRRHVACHKGER